MPSLLAEYDEIVRALDAAYGRPDPARPCRGRRLPRPADRVPRSAARRHARPRSSRSSTAPAWRTSRRRWRGPRPESWPTCSATAGGPLPAGLVAGLQRLAGWVAEQGGMEATGGAATETLREELRAIRGIGPGTADRLLLRRLRSADLPARPIRLPGPDPPRLDRPDRRLRRGPRGGRARRPRHDPAALAALASWFERLAAPCRVGKPAVRSLPVAAVPARGRAARSVLRPTATGRSAFRSPGVRARSGAGAGAGASAPGDGTSRTPSRIEPGSEAPAACLRASSLDDGRAIWSSSAIRSGVRSRTRSQVGVGDGELEGEGAKSGSSVDVAVGQQELGSAAPRP